MECTGSVRVEDVFRLGFVLAGREQEQKRDDAHRSDEGDDDLGEGHQTFFVHDGLRICGSRRMATGRSAPPVLGGFA